MYTLLRPLLFQMDAEKAHELTFRLLESLQSWPKLLPAPIPLVPDERLQVDLGGLRFEHPLGLAAGLDKNARLLPVWRRLGFSFVEVGTITPRPQAGNPKPRLFRLPKDKALINRMGFNNEGADALAKRLQSRPAGLIVGANIGKNKDTPLEQAAEDYRACIRRLNDCCDFFTVNISSPNTPGLRSLQEDKSLRRLLDGVSEEIQAQRPQKPWLVKIAPDLEVPEIDFMVQAIAASGAAGIIATNTTTSRAGLQTLAQEVEALGAGGLSGAPLTTQSRKVIAQIAATGMPVVGVGGILSGADALGHLQAGAQLVQVYSGLIYRGPELLREIYNACLQQKQGI